jgi:hypothetical protein
LRPVREQAIATKFGSAIDPQTRENRAEDMAAIATLDKKQTALVDHRDPEMVKWISNAIRNT